MSWSLRESVAEVDFCRWYDTKTPYLRTKLNLRGRRGWPDQCLWVPLRPLMIEFKAPGEEPRRLQDHVHGLLKGNAYEVQVHHDAAEAIAAVRRAIEARDAELLALARLGLGPGAVGAGPVPARGGVVLSAKGRRGPAA